MTESNSSSNTGGGGVSSGKCVGGPTPSASEQHRDATQTIEASSHQWTPLVAGFTAARPPLDSFFRPSSLSATADKLQAAVAAPGASSATVPAASAFSTTASPFGRLCPPRLPVPGGGICNGGGAGGSGAESSDAEAASASNEASGTGSGIGNPFNRFVRPAGSAAKPFVFGENLASRVELAEPSDELSKGTAASAAAPAAVTFADAAAEAADDNGATVVAAAGSGAKSDTAADASCSTSAADVDGADSAATAASSLLAASAEKYERDRQRQEFSQVAVVTGEEDEENVLHMPCRVFVFDASAKSWAERGHAHLRLNDRRPGAGERDRGRVPLKSRLICRSQGGLKVIVNTLLWPEMSVESVGPKRLRVSVQSSEDEGSVGLRVCLLVLNSPVDAQQLAAALQSRLRELRAFSTASACALPTYSGVKRRASDFGSGSGDKHAASPTLPNAGGKNGSSGADNSDQNDDDGEDDEDEDDDDDLDKSAGSNCDFAEPVERKRRRPDPTSASSSIVSTAASASAAAAAEESSAAN